MPLVSVATDETIEILEAQPSRPEVEWAGLAGLPVRHVVILTVPRRVPAVLFEDFRHGAAALRHYCVVAGVAGAELGNDTGGAGVMIASGDQGRARGRAKRGGVE